MADVTSSVRERGQLILIGGLSLAVVFVVLALVLNSAIYTENLATRSSDTPADTAVQFRQDAIAGAGTAMGHANRNGSDRTYSERYDEYQKMIEKWQGAHARYSAVNGLLTEVNAPSGAGNEGTLVVDDNSTTDFTSRADKPDWTVADDVQVRQFRLNVTRDSLPAPDDSTVEDMLSGSGTSAFYAEVDDGSNSWRVAVYRDSTPDPDTVKVMSYDSSSGNTRTCTAQGSTVQVDITGGTLDGTHCEALSFVGELSGTHDIRYSNADLIQGTYELTVDQEEEPFRSEVNTTNGYSTYFNDSSEGTPYTTPAIYSATIELVYDGPSVTYETTVRVAPGEPGESTVAPPMAHLDAFGEVSDGGPFDVSRPVSEPNAGLYAVVGIGTHDGTDETPTHSGTSRSGPEEPDNGDVRFAFESPTTDSNADSGFKPNEYNLNIARSLP